MSKQRMVARRGAMAAVAAAAVVVCWAGFAMPALAQHAQHQKQHEHTHAPQAASTAAKSLKAGQKWQTDAPMREAMDGIRKAMMAVQADVAAQRLDASGYAKLAGTIQKNTDDIVARCKLTPDADKAFHAAVLAPLTNDADTMRNSPKLDVKRVAALGVMQTLRHYGTYFDHPGWSLDSAVH